MRWQWEICWGEDDTFENYRGENETDIEQEYCLETDVQVKDNRQVG